MEGAKVGHSCVFTCVKYMVCDNVMLLSCFYKTKQKQTTFSVVQPPPHLEETDGKF